MFEDFKRPNLLRLLDKNLQPTVAFNELFVYESKMNLLIRIAQGTTKKVNKIKIK
jgi:hypothetical protein